MDFKEKKENLNSEFNKNQQEIQKLQQLLQQLLIRQNQLTGQYQLIEEIEKGNFKKEEKK